MISPRLNLIIPYHNPELEEVDRLFTSLTKQGIPYDNFKVIAVDDNSDDVNRYREYINRNFVIPGGMNVQFVETDTDVHCPGNTRREGMKHLDNNADFLCFCDQDDFFEENAFALISEYIKNYPFDEPIYVISTVMSSYDLETEQYTRDFPHKAPWLHGKWYNIPELIGKYNINFKKDLFTHEDIYFNSCVYAKLFDVESDLNYIDIRTYRWVENPNSITRGYKGERGYLYEWFQDYIEAASGPYWEQARDKGNVQFVNQIMMTILHCYFYYEAASYYEGPDKYKDVLNCIIRLFDKVQTDLDYDLDFIVNFVYSDAQKFSDVQEDCESCTGKIICKTSFKDFVYKVGVMDEYEIL